MVYNAKNELIVNWHVIAHIIDLQTDQYFTNCIYFKELLIDTTYCTNLQYCFQTINTFLI